MDTREIPDTYEIIEPQVTYYVLRPDFNDLLIYSDCTLTYNPFVKTYYIHYHLKHSDTMMQDWVDRNELAVLYASSLNEYRVWCRDDDVTLALDSLSIYISEVDTKRVSELLTQMSRIRKHEQRLLNIINDARNQ